MDFDSRWVWWLAAGSVLMFFGSVLAIPPIIVRLPADYFNHAHRHRAKPRGFALFVYYGWLLGKNLAGVVFVLMGIAMLVLPGQGIISILLGLTLINFPGKFRLERFLATRKPILSTMNWLRARANRPPLDIQDPTPDAQSP